MNIEKRIESICGVPVIVWGSRSDRVFMYIHGQGGCKEEAEIIASTICNRGWQLLSLDLPGHGERTDEDDSFVPWRVAPELSEILKFAKEQWTEIALYANSIGAWFSLLSFADEKFSQCLFVSPVLDMKRLISNMMRLENVSEERLEQELIIPTSLGQTLSWEYWRYVLDNPITKWDSPTRILYAEDDDLITRDTVDEFASGFNCDLTVVKDCEHWFHTPPQLQILREWVETSLT